MTRRADPHQLAKLADVQRTKRLAAEAALAEARIREADARAREEVARDDAAVAEQAWFAYLASPGFAPEGAGALARRLMMREDVASEAAGRSDTAAALHEHRRGDWQRADAQLSLTSAALRDARRAASRHHEERSLAEATDRVTRGWGRT